MLFRSLDKGEWLGNLTYTPEERLVLDECQLLAAKPVLFVANVSEQADADEAMVKSVRDFADKRGARVVTICGQLEAELSTLPENERLDFLKEMGLTESGLVRLTREAYTLLNIVTFFTAGEIESRAWPIPKNMKAPKRQERFTPTWSEASSVPRSITTTICWLAGRKRR